MKTYIKLYKGYTIQRYFSGWYNVVGTGLKADTMAGIKQLINQRMGG